MLNYMVIYILYMAYTLDVASIYMGYDMPHMVLDMGLYMFYTL